MTPQTAGRASPNQAGKPSLYADTTVPWNVADAQGDSILGGLESSRPSHRLLVGALGMALTCAIAIGGWQSGDFFREKETVSVMLAEAPQMPDAGSTVAGASKGQTDSSSATESASSAEDRGEQMAAVIISDSAGADATSPAIAAESAAVKPAASVQVSDSAESGAGQSGITAETTLATPMHAGSASRLAPAIAQGTGTKPALSLEVPTAAKQTTTASMDAQVAAKIPPGSLAKDGSTSAAKPSNKTDTKARPAEKDGDVELIAALLSRVSARPEQAIEDTARKPAPGKGIQRQSAAEQKKAKKTGVARENASPGLASAETQLKRCSSMGFFDAELCRFRVCEGLWGREPACPEYSQVSAALP